MENRIKECFKHDKSMFKIDKGVMSYENLVRQGVIHIAFGLKTLGMTRSICVVNLAII